MWPAPEDPAVARRMHTAHQRAQTALGVHSAHDAREAWGWRGRTLGRPVTASDGPAWLRLATAREGQNNPIFWNGSLDAESAIPGSVPRPRLRDHHDWNEHGWEYRAELYERVTTPPISISATRMTTPNLPREWWAAARSALDDIASVPTDRYTITQHYLDYAMPRFLGGPIETTAPSWTTAHGDFHFANLCAPTLHIIDWEGWGLAPTGYDAATLHTNSLPAPQVAARIRQELAHHLDTSAGRFAELVAITELLHTTTRGDNLHLIQLLRQRAAHLLGRPVPCGSAEAGRPTRSLAGWLPESDLVGGPSE